MNNLRIFILGSVVGLSACTGTDKKTAASETDSVSTMKLAGDSNIITAAIDSTNSQNTSAWKGTYEGVLPCNDCVGTVLKIMLHADNTYMLTVKYLKPKDSKETMWDGKFTWINDTTIQLEGNREIPAKYLIAENKIIQLDVNGKQVEGALAHKYVLNRTDLKK